MSHVTLDEATRQKLGAGANGGTVELRNEAGEVIGYFVRPDKMQVMEQARELWLAWVEETFPPEMIERSRNDPRPRRTMEEVIRFVEDGGK
jgi:hypothetical protein